MISFLIVGSGYRSLFYGRVAARYPELFRALFLCRSEEKKNAMEQETGILATTSLEEALSFGADFVVVAVNKGSIASVTEEWTLRGYPVLTETPLGASFDELRKLRGLYEQGKRIITCEQYHRYPSILAGLAAVQEGLIGEPWSAYLSLAHDYHGASLLRHLLGTYGEAYEISALSTQNPVVKTASRAGDHFDGEVVSEKRDLALITFSSGKSAVYDFSGVQYHSHIRSRHLCLRGERGEWSDGLIRFVDGENIPRVRELRPLIPERYEALLTPELTSGCEGFRGDLTMENWEDEFAIASILLDMKAYIQGGEEPYPFAEAYEDALFWLRLQENVVVEEKEKRRG